MRTRRSVVGLENEPVSGCDDSGWRTRETKSRNQAGENPLASSPSPPPLILAPPLPPRTCFPPLKGSHPKPAVRHSKMSNKTKPDVSNLRKVASESGGDSGLQSDASSVR